MFAVRKPSIGEIIATSANQIVLLKFHWTYKNVVLYSPDTPFPLAVLKEGLGTRLCQTLRLCGLGQFSLRWKDTERTRLAAGLYEPCSTILNPQNRLRYSVY